ERYLAVIEQRCAARRTGASWQRATVQALTSQGADRPAALAGMLRGYLEHMHSNQPVHAWPQPSRASPQPDEACRGRLGCGGSGRWDLGRGPACWSTVYEPPVAVSWPTGPRPTGALYDVTAYGQRCAV
ncbi:MAG TPA: hypothetical protein VE196_12885, partial [Pseudonocardiaceae bacterium]|nr:hypothetical protein [Pseudonocardiaceae bacterium]